MGIKIKTNSKLFKDKSGQTNKKRISNQEINQAYILYCLRNNVIPTKTSRKKLTQIIFDNLTNNLNFEHNLNRNLALTPFEIIEIYKLRSITYAKNGYNKQFSQEFPSLDVDEYDSHSITLAYRKRGKIVGTLRIIQDNGKKLQSEKICPLDFQRQQSKFQAEISRVVVSQSERGKGIAGKLLKEATKIGMYNGWSGFVVASLSKHIPMYSQHSKKHDILYNGEYGEIKQDCAVYIISIDKNQETKFKPLELAA